METHGNRDCIAFIIRDFVDIMGPSWGMPIMRSIVC